MQSLDTSLFLLGSGYVLNVTLKISDESSLIVDKMEFGLIPFQTPLHYASRHGHIQCVVLLIKAGAKLNASQVKEEEMIS